MIKADIIELIANGLTGCAESSRIIESVGIEDLPATATGQPEKALVIETRRDDGGWDKWSVRASDFALS